MGRRQPRRIDPRRAQRARRQVRVLRGQEARVEPGPVRGVQADRGDDAAGRVERWRVGRRGKRVVFLF